MSTETNAGQGGNDAPGGSGPPNGGDQGSTKSTPASGAPDGAGGASPKAGAEAPRKHSDESKADIEALKAEIDRLRKEKDQSVSRRKAAKSKAEDAEATIEELMGKVQRLETEAEGKAKAERRLTVRDRIDKVIDQHPEASPKLLRALLRGSGIDLGDDDEQKVMEKISEFLDEDTLATISRRRGTAHVPASGQGAAPKPGVHHPTTGKRIL